jgi:hypothetical protein
MNLVTNLTLDTPTGAKIVLTYDQPSDPSKLNINVSVRSEPAVIMFTAMEGGESARSSSPHVLVPLTHSLTSLLHRKLQCQGHCHQHWRHCRFDDARVQQRRAHAWLSAVARFGRCQLPVCSSCSQGRRAMPHRDRHQGRRVALLVRPVSWALAQLAPFAAAAPRTRPFAKVSANCDFCHSIRKGRTKFWGSD